MEVDQESQDYLKAQWRDYYESLLPSQRIPIIYLANKCVIPYYWSLIKAKALKLRIHRK